jgi:hypothetical protein
MSNLAIITNFHILGPCVVESEAECLALMVFEANILENQETKVAMVVVAIAGTMAEAEYSSYCPNQILAGEESQRRKREPTFYYRFMSSSYKASCGRTQQLEKNTV